MVMGHWNARSKRSFLFGHDISPNLVLGTYYYVCMSVTADGYLSQVLNAETPTAC